jgi:hypothetical protein
VLIIIFLLWLNAGLNQTNGSISGPTHKKAITKKAVLKYHLSGARFIRNSPQKRHFIASSWILSAQ